MTVTAISPSWSAMGRAEQPYASAGPAELTITVQVTVSGSVAPGVATQVLREVQEFADRMNGARVRLGPVVETGHPRHIAVEPDGHRPHLRVVPDTRVVLLDGEPVQLTRREFDLLLFLCRNRLRVVSREELLAQVWGYAWTGGTRTVDVHIRRLRMKLGHEIVSTVHGVGYRVDDRARVTVEHAAGPARRAG
jgi:DNA-binding winged helix-turn-helix (wHTH) protein